MKILVNVLRWIAFYPVLFTVFYLLGLGMDWLVYNIIRLSFWLILFIVFGSFGFVSLLGLFGSAASLVVLVAPNKKVGVISFSLVSTLTGLSSVYSYWMSLGISTSKLVLVSIMTLVFFGVLVAAILEPINDQIV